MEKVTKKIDNEREREPVEEGRKEAALFWLEK